MTVAIARSMNRRRTAPVSRRPAPQPTNRLHAKLRERIDYHLARVQAGTDPHGAHEGAARQLRALIGDPLPEPQPEPKRAQVAGSEPPPAEPERRPPPPMHRVVRAETTPPRVLRAKYEEHR